MKSLAVIVLFALSLLGVASALAARARQQLVFEPAHRSLATVERMRSTRAP